MRIQLFAATFLLCAGISACADGNGNSANETATANASVESGASYDRDSEAGRAYRALLECAATTQYARRTIGGETFSMEEPERRANIAREAQLRDRSRALQERMNAQGAALGLSGEAITAEFNAHQQTLLHGPGMGTRLEHARSMADRSDACARSYLDAA